MNSKPAGFPIRLLATLTDSSIFFLPHSFFLLYIAGSKNLEDFVSGLALYTTLLLIPSLILTSFYNPLMTTHFGGSVGKLLSGLSIVDNKDQFLNFKRSFFRENIGYAFSGLVFGLGYFSIIKDEQKLAWHDKATGSKVLIKGNIWPLAAVVLLATITVNVLTIQKTLKTFDRSPAKTQLINIFKSTPTPTKTNTNTT